MTTLSPQFTSDLSSAGKLGLQQIEGIAAVSEESAAGAEEVSASTEEQSASVEEMAAGAQELAALAAQLQEAVDQFVLEPQAGALQQERARVTDWRSVA